MNDILMRDIGEFLLYLKVEKNLAPRTVKEYQMDLTLLRVFMVERGHTDWRQITYRDLRHFLHYIQEERNNSATARSRKVSSIRGFFKFLHEEGMIQENPALQLQKPKLEKKLPVYLSIEECKRFLQVIHDESTHAIRDVTIIFLFLFTGMRLSELTSLNTNDLDFSNQIIRVFGKGRKERIVPILPQLYSTLMIYLNHRSEILGSDSQSFEPLFFTRNRRTWNRIHRRTIHELFIKYSKRAKIDQKHFSAHKLRHTFATLLYSQGVDLLQLKNLLGHANIGTTEIYTHTTTEQLKEAIFKHPLMGDQLETYRLN